MHKLTQLGILIVAASAAFIDTRTSAGEGLTHAPPLTHEEVKAVVDSHIAELKACMSQHGSAMGKLVVEFGILSNGKVTEPKAKERSSNAALDRCITQSFNGFTFPKPHGGVTMGVSYPFVFSAPPPPPAPGKLDDKQVVDAVHSHQADINACLGEATKEKPNITGTVEVAMVINPSGKVIDAHIAKTTTTSNKLDVCLVARVKTWLFPKPGGGEFAVVYPFVFKGAEP